MAAVATMLALVTASAVVAAEKSYTLSSPDGRVGAIVSVGDKLTYAVTFDGKRVVAPSQIALRLADGEVLGEGDRLQKAKSASVDRIVVPQFYFRTEIADRYNALTLSFREGYSVEFRAYDEGITYRFATSRKSD